MATRRQLKRVSPTYHGGATLDIDAPPQVVWSLVSDLERMSEWSPEVYAIDWLDGATRAAKGATFVGKNRIGVIRWSMRVRIIEFEPSRRLAFATQEYDVDQTRWSFTIEPISSGSRVTERFNVVGPISLIGRTSFPEKRRKPQLAGACRLTLSRLKIAAEATRGQSVW
jgi:uncharacterized protein YndB with AHSA1/START domain